VDLGAPEIVAGSLGIVIIVLVALLIWRHGRPHDPEPPE